MEENDRRRITEAARSWLQVKYDQQTASEGRGAAQGGRRATVTGGRHLAAIEDVVLDELDSLREAGLSIWRGRQARLPGFFRPSKDWDLVASLNGAPFLALEFKSMSGSEGKNLNNRADEVIGAAYDLKCAQDKGLLPPEMRLGYIFVMEVTQDVTVPVSVQTKIGTVDQRFNGAGYIDRMAILCERLRDQGLYDMTWALGVTRNPVRVVEPRPSVGWGRFREDLAMAVCGLGSQIMAKTRMAQPDRPDLVMYAGGQIELPEIDIKRERLGGNSPSTEPLSRATGRNRGRRFFRGRDDSPEPEF